MRTQLYGLFTILSLSVNSQNLNVGLDKILNEQHNSTGQSYCLMVISKGKIIYQNSVGNLKKESSIKSDKRSNYRMASVSKQFTAGAIFLLEQQKKLNLQQPLSDFFPEFSPSVGEKVTVHHLLTHTSGIKDYEELIDDSMKIQLSDLDILNMVKGIEKTYFVPGEKFKYSNTAYCILALIVEKASDMTLHDFCKQYIFNPLGMKNTVWYGPNINIRVYGYARDKEGKIVFRDQSLTSATLGDGGLYTSLNDYSKWYLGRKRILGMDFNKMIQSSSSTITDQHAYAYGWFYEHDKNNIPKVILHSGATCGFSNIVIEIPEKEMAIVYFTNLADHHDSFLLIEKALKSFGWLSKDFSYRKMHEETH